MSGNLQENDQLEGSAIDVMIILKWALKKQIVMARIRIMWLRTGSSGDVLKGIY